MRFASADRRSLWLWCGLGVLAWLMLSSIFGAAPASAAERPDAAPAASASPAAQQRGHQAGESSRPAGGGSTASTTAAASARNAAAPAKKPSAPAQKAAAPVQKPAAPASKTAAPAGKPAAPAGKAAAPAGKPAAPAGKPAAPAKKTATATALGAASAAASDASHGTPKAKNSHTPAGNDRGVSALSPTAAMITPPGLPDDHERGPARQATPVAAEHAATHLTDSVVGDGIHRGLRTTGASHAVSQASGAQAASTAAPVIATEPEPVDHRLPGLALSATATTGCATASGASSILSLAGEVTRVASCHGIIRLTSFTDAGERPPVGPAATTDSRPD